MEGRRRRLRWLPPFVMGIMAIGFAYHGFRLHAAAHSLSLSSSDLLYRALELFTLSGGAVDAPTPWQLDLGRFLAPAVSAYAAIMAIFVVFQDRIRQTRLIGYRDHVVICGLGVKGRHLAERIRAAGRKVVVIEMDPANPNVSHCRSQGIVVIQGSAEDAALLHRARVEHASHVFAFCGDDRLNTEVATTTEALLHRLTRRPLTFVVHIGDTQLFRQLREKELIARLSNRFKIDYINIHDMGARAVLKSYPILVDDESGSARSPQVLIAGLNHLGQSLVSRIVADWRHLRRDDIIGITVLDRRAPMWLASFLKRYPRHEQHCDIRVKPAAGELIESDTDLELSNAELADMDLIFVCRDNPASATSTAIALHRRLREMGRRTPVIVPMGEEEGIARLLPGPEEDGGTFGNISTYGIYPRCLTAELLDDDMFISIARAIHEDYVWNRKIAGETVVDNPSMKPWPELEETLQKSNIDQAIHLSERLQAFGHEIVLLTDWEAEYYEFPPDVVEGMARMEHDRWMRDKVKDGFRYSSGPKSATTSPALVPWADLSEEDRDKDRQAVSGVPRFLAKAGFQVVQVRESREG